MIHALSLLQSLALCCMPLHAYGQVQALHPYYLKGLDWALPEQSVRIDNKYATVRWQIWRNDHLNYSFGLRRSQLALKWKSGHSKGGFAREQSQVHFILIPTHWSQKKPDPCRFYCPKWGVRAFFPRVYCINSSAYTMKRHIYANQPYCAAFKLHVYCICI